MLRPASIFASLFLLFIASTAIGQKGIPDKIGTNTERGPSLNAVKKKAENGVERGDYSVARHYYGLLWQRDSTDGEALMSFGEAALANTQYDTSIWAFQTLLNRGLTKDAGHTMVRLAYAYYCSGNYDEAERRYHQVETVAGVTKKSKEEAEDGLENCARAKGVMGEKQIKLNNPVSKLNTRRAEYAPVRVDNVFYYTSYSRPLNGDTTRSRMQILTASPDGDSMRIMPGDLNADEKHSAYLAFNTNQTVQYFARADHEKESGIQFHLYRRKSAGDGAWGPVEKLPEYINPKDFITTQPNVGRLPGDTLETLFFVSNRPGSAGKDIWYCHILKDSFSAPQNLKALNTTGDEVSPFFFSGDSSLYFSSNSHPQMNLGGFDIFRSKRTNTGWTPPAPMPPPFNSGANDAFFSVSNDCEMRFFASNRGGSVNYSVEECCYNLYGTEKTLEIRIDVFHEITRARLAQTEMRLMEQTASGLTEVSKVAVPGYDYTFPLSANRDYVLIVSKPGFNSKTIKFNSRDDGWGVCLKEPCYLKPLQIDLNVYVFNLDTKEPVTGADIYFYDQSARRSDGSVQTGPAGSFLDSVALRNHPNVFAHFDLKPDHEYRMMATKLGFTDDSATASTLGITRDTTLRRDLFIQQGLQYTVRVFDEFTREPLDFVSFTLKETGIDDASNEKVYTHTSGANDNEYNRMIFYDRRYNISATKEGYLEDNSRRKGFRTDSLGLKKIPFQHIYDTLYLRRISLPILLYYDNDVPNKGKLAADTSTSWLYADTYLKYYYPKKNLWQGYYEQKALYLKECCDGMAKTDPRYIEMDTFFDNQVQREWNRLRAFREYLTDKLRSGECVKVNIAGFASPLGNAAYNKRLTRRRVDCLLNHLQKFEGETDIAEYYNQGRFIIEPNYNGSEDAVKAGVPGTGKASVYSVSAAKARRVMIVSMEIFKCDQPLSGTLVPGSRK